MRSITALLLVLLVAGLASSYTPRASAVDLLAEVQATLDEGLEPLVGHDVGRAAVEGVATQADDASKRRSLLPGYGKGTGNRKLEETGRALLQYSGKGRGALGGDRKLVGLDERKVPNRKTLAKAPSEARRLRVKTAPPP